MWKFKISKRYVQTIRNLSKTYITNLIVTLEQYLKFINIHTLKNKYNNINEFTLNDIRSINNSDIYNFIYFLAENNYKTNSRIVKIEHLKVFYNYLFKIKHNIFNQPFKILENERKLHKEIPNYLSLSESEKLLKVYDNKENFHDIRNKAMLYMFLNCGLRISELANLNIDDFDLKDNKFKIIGKGNKERTGYLNKSARKALDEYLKIRNEIKVTKSKDKNALFLNQYYSRITTRSISRNIKSSYQLAGIDEKRYTVHSLRHTCATLLYISGIPIRTIQEFLGHAQIDTTNIYAQTYNQEVKDAMLGFPLAEFKMEDALGYCA